MLRALAAHWRLALAVAGGGVLASAALYQIQIQQNRARAQSAFAALAERAAADLAARMQLYEYGLRGVRGTVLALGEGPVARDAFLRYSQTRDIAREFPGARGFGFIRRVAEADSAAFEARMRADGRPGFRVRQLTPHGGERYVIEVIEPLAPNLAAEGLDLASEPRRAAAAQAAMESGRAAITAPVTLVQEHGAAQRSFLLLLPVYRAGAPNGPATLLGWSYAPLVTDAILRPLGHDTANYDLVLLDVSGPAPEEFYRRGQSGAAPGLPQATRTRDMFGRRWQLRMTAHPAFVDGLHQPAPAWTILAGSAASVLLALLCAALAANRQRRRDGLRDQARLTAMVRHASDAIVGEDSAGNITIWNTAAEQLFGYSAAQALGQPVARLLQFEGTSGLAETGHARDCRLLHQDGRRLDVAMTSSASRDARGQLTGVTRMVHDISERKRAERQLLEFNSRLEQQVNQRTAELDRARSDMQTLFDALPSRIGYWDRQLCNKAANRAYCEWLALAPDQILGRRFDALHGQAWVRQAAPHIEAVLQGQAQYFEQSLSEADGSTGHAITRLLPDVRGGTAHGFYVIIHDVTEIHRSRTALVQERTRLQDILLGTRAGSWEWELAAASITVDAQWNEIVGAGSDAPLLRSLRSVRALLHPADRKNVRSALRPVLAGQLQLCEAELRLRHAEGHWVWVLARGRVPPGAPGAPLRLHGTVLDISGLKQTERRLAESEAFLARVAKISGVGGWQYSARHATLVWTAQTRHIIGAGPAHCSSLDAMLALFPAPGRHALAQALAAGAAGGAPFDLELPMLTLGGTLLQARVSGEALPEADGGSVVVGALQDVTAQRAMEADLRRINITQGTILDNMPCGLSVFDADLKLVGHNQQFRTLLELDPLFAHGMPSFPDIIRFNAERGEYGAVDIEAHVARAVALAQHPTAHTFERLRPDGTPLEVRGAPLPGGGFVTTYTDMSEHKRNETRLIAAMQDAEAASRAKSEFVANMSHEIRTPMNAVLGMAQLLATTRLNPEQRSHLDMITASGQALLAILNDILDFSKIEAGRMELDHAPFALDDILTLLSSIMSACARGQDLALAIGVEPGTPMHWTGDAQRLQQILINLVSNAVKFTAQGEVSMLVAARPGATPGRSLLQISVRDTGIGMDAAQCERVFSAFSQADASVTRRYGGTGLGLAISQHLAHMMGGAISVDSTPGQGSTFCVALPLAPAPGPAPEQPLRLLLIDAHARSADLLAMTMRGCGWQVDAVATAGTAPTAVPRYDAILADPHGSGSAELEALGQLRAANGAPLVLMLSSHQQSLAALAPTPSLQPDALLTKPVTAAALRAALRAISVLGQDRPAPAPQPRFDGARVLLAEDNALNRLVACGMLEKLGLAVEVAHDGAQALALLRADPGRCDLVLMDVQMPVMDGLSATAVLRRELGLTLPVLAMTAGVTAQEQALCRQAGMNDVVAKPVVFAQLAAALAAQLGLAQEGAVSAPEAGGVFDVDEMLMLCEKNPGARDQFLQAAHRALEAGAGQLAAARAAAEGGDHAGAARLIHALRGSLGQLGAQRFAEHSQVLERAVHGGSAAGDEFERARELLEQTLHAGRRWFAEQPQACQSVH